MDFQLFSKVDRELTELFRLQDPLLKEVLQSIREASLPEHSVSAIQGQFLMQLVRMSKARRIIEIGTLGAYSTIWLARGLDRDGKIISIEVDPRAASLARTNISKAGLQAQVEIIEGDARQKLTSLNDWAVDFVFMDADKASYCDFYNWAVPRMSSGGLIVADNVIREGKILRPDDGDEKVVGVRRYLELLAKEESTVSSVHQQVGEKGYDGFSISLVL